MRYLNFYGYSDVEPYEVVKTISEKTVEIRPMKATEKEWDKTFIPGGFCGTFINQDKQQWAIEPDPNAEVIRARLGRKGWKSERGFHRAEEAPRKFYDFNF